MKYSEKSFQDSAAEYLNKVHASISPDVMYKTEILARGLLDAWIAGNQVLLCGNGGSAANALHIANDLHYGIGACGKHKEMPGLKVEALSGNTAIITCLANDTGYENIYANQIRVKGNKNDILLVLSGSGNSENVVNAIKEANKKKMKTFAIVAFDGGLCKDICEEVIHVQVDDMQVAEDSQLIIGHICMQWLCANRQV